jgi:hypothetical protein
MENDKLVSVTSKIVWLLPWGQYNTQDITNSEQITPLHNVLFNTGPEFLQTLPYRFNVYDHQRRNLTFLRTGTARSRTVSVSLAFLQF